MRSHLCKVCLSTPLGQMWGTIGRSLGQRLLTCAPSRRTATRMRKLSSCALSSLQRRPETTTRALLHRLLLRPRVHHQHRRFP